MWFFSTDWHGLILTRSYGKGTAGKSEKEQQEQRPNLQIVDEYGGDDETRTRDLCRDSGPMIGFTTTYKAAGTAKGP
jgi:hypothetical protein